MSLTRDAQNLMREPLKKSQESLEPVKENRLPIPKTYKLFIDGKFPRTESGRYYELRNPAGEILANVSLGSRKDIRDAVSAAREALPKWNEMSALNRGQILYRFAEMLEGRRTQFIAELKLQGRTEKEAQIEVDLAIDRLVYYAGWADKFSQIFSYVNPVASSHFNFSSLEPTGVVGVVAPETAEYGSLLGFISLIAPILVGGNTVIAIASYALPLSAITLAEVIHTSDIPAGVINIITGSRDELLSPLATHMDVNAISLASRILSTEADPELKLIQSAASLNVKRTVLWEASTQWIEESNQNPYRILETMEVKTTWHPIGA